MDQGYGSIPKPTDCALCEAPLRAPFCVHIAAGLAELERAPIVWIDRDAAGRARYNVVPTGGAR